uniref:Matrix n=1 Tax=maize Iranian mosaic virus TaxID=348823 RepID=A0A0D5CEQ3_9RHAB|nr:matrix [maize Iranian mosaic virus]
MDTTIRANASRPLQPDSPSLSTVNQTCLDDTIVGCHFTLELRAHTPGIRKMLEDGEITIGSVYKGIYSMMKNDIVSGLTLGRDATSENKLHILAASFLCVLRKYEGDIKIFQSEEKDQFSGRVELLARVHIGDDHLGVYDPECYQLVGVKIPDGMYHLTLKTTLTAPESSETLSLILGIIITSPARVPPTMKPMGVDTKALLPTFPPGTNPWKDIGEVKEQRKAISRLRSILS